MKRFLRAAGILGVVGLLAIPVVARVLTDRALADNRADGFTPAEAELFLTDGRRVTALGVFPEGGTRDAGAVLNPYLRLDGPDGPDAGPDTPAAWVTDPTFRDTLRCPVRTDTWPSCITAVPTVDLAWMASLAAYDTWDPGASGPYARWLAAHPDLSAWESPLPNYVPLLDAARARLLQGRARGDLPAALAEVRKLAQLVWTSEGTVAAMMAIALLNVERAAYDDAVATGLDHGGWEPVSKADVEALRRYSFGLIVAYGGDAGEDTLARLEREAPGFPGRCNAIWEAMTLVGPGRNVFDGRWPGEVDLAPRYTALDAAAASSGCRLHHVGRAWRGETRALDLSMLAESPDAVPGPLDFLSQVPWVRQAATAPVLSAYAANFNRYRAARDPA